MTHLSLLNSDQLNPEVVRDFLTLARQIDKEKPDPAQLKELRRMLTEHPDLWRATADLAYEAALHLIAGLKTDLAVKEALRRGWQALKTDLGYPKASVLERLMIDQVILAWLQLNITQCHYADILSHDLPLATLNYWERRLSAAQSRYLKACQVLAKNHKVMFKSPVQLNIAAPGSQQMNMINPFLDNLDFPPETEAEE